MKPEINKDKVFAQPTDNVQQFVFNSKVASVFPDMIDRSVPGYREMVSLIGTISAKFAKNETNIYDLGCSLGAVTYAILANNSDFSGKIFSIDSSSAMIQRFKNEVPEKYSTIISPIEEDICDSDIVNASFVALNLTLQFIPIDRRDNVIKNIYNGINTGGAFILSEKIIFNDNQEEEFIHDLLFNYKKCRGYSDIEVQQKKEALNGVLVPETINRHIDRLKRAGFSKVYQWYQSFNFVSFIAIKE